MVAFIIAIIWFIPIFFLIYISFKTSGEYNQTAIWALPQGFALFENIKFVWQKTNFGIPLMNSLFYVATGIIAGLFVSSLAAYAVARLKLRFSFFWFILIWAGMIFPVQIYLIPLYKAYIKLNLYDTKIGLFLIYTAIIIPFCFFVFRNHFKSLPVEMQEAARLDGCTNFQIYWKIMIPNSFAPMAVLALFQGNWIWNNLMLGLILSSSWNVRPVMNALMLIGGQYTGLNVPAIMVTTLLSSLPSIILFLALQKYFIKGLTVQVAGE